MRHNFAPSKLEQDVMDTVTGLSQSGGLGELNTPPPNFLPETLTLSQPGGQIMLTTILRAPRIFRPCDGPENGQEFKKIQGSQIHRFH